MKKIILTAVAIVAAASSQTVTGIRSLAAQPQANTGQSNVEAGRPLLGYLADSSNVLYSVVGSPGSPMWGEPLALPDSTAVTFLPPRQEYALLASDGGLSFARLSRSTVYAGPLIPNTMRRPDQVSFSPSGETIALFSASESRIEVVSRTTPGQAEVKWSVPVSAPGELLKFAISDDAHVLVAAFANQPVVCSLNGARWQQLATAFWPDAWTFLPNSHSLVLSDRREKAIVLLSVAEHAPLATHVLASGAISANLLASNKQGTELLAAAEGSSASWSIDLVHGTVAVLPDKGKVDSLTLLRDGQTFLVSRKQSPVLIKLSGEPVQSAATNTSR